MSKQKKTPEQKELKKLRKQLTALTEIMHEQGEMIAELHAEYVVGNGNIQPLQRDNSVQVAPPVYAVPQPVVNDGDSDQWGVNPEVTQEAYPAMPVKNVTVGRDPEASEYTFHFTQEDLVRLGIPDMSYHLEEIPGREGRLRIVEGPPTKLLPEHRELVDERRKAEEQK